MEASLGSSASGSNYAHCSKCKQYVHKVGCMLDNCGMKMVTSSTPAAITGFYNRPQNEGISIIIGDKTYTPDNIQLQLNKRQEGVNLTNFNTIVKQIPLRTRIMVSLQMSDYANWHNGTYTGDIEALKVLTDSIIKDVFKWMLDGMPEGFKYISDNDTTTINPNL